VGRYRLSRRAERDLLEIGAFTLKQWGPDQVRRYLAKLDECCKQIAEMPTMGRTANEVRPGLRRIEHGRHVIFYRESPEGILVGRIVHQRMLAEHQPFTDE
jgi:toxin ParE1/3/4